MPGRKAILVSRRESERAAIGAEGNAHAPRIVLFGDRGLEIRLLTPRPARALEDVGATRPVALPVRLPVDAPRRSTFIVDTHGKHVAVTVEGERVAKEIAVRELDWSRSLDVGLLRPGRARFARTRKRHRPAAESSSWLPLIAVALLSSGIAPTARCYHRRCRPRGTEW